MVVLSWLYRVSLCTGVCDYTTIHPNNSTTTIHPNNSTTTIRPNNSTTTIHPNNSTMTIHPNNSTMTIHPNNKPRQYTQITTYYNSPFILPLNNTLTTPFQYPSITLTIPFHYPLYHPPYPSITLTIPFHYPLYHPLKASGLWPQALGLRPKALGQWEAGALVTAYFFTAQRGM